MIDVGQQLGGYTIIGRIGRGGMGEVFLAQHRRVSRRAAVKVLVPELSQKATVLERFFNEARATSLIKHPGIVEILDCDVLDGQAFIIMEFLEGENLGAYLQRTGPMGQDLPFLFGVGIAVAGAVGAAHAKPIIHRDLKPDNIYLHLPSEHDPTVAVKILDFGIAKLVQNDGGPSQTSTGMLLGTPAYMSPEQCRGAGHVDGRSDIYALGCILYEAVSGRPPFVREGMGELIVAHVSETPEPPTAHSANVPRALNDLIMRMLSKAPDSRPHTMDDVAAELRTCAQSLGISVEGRLRPRAPVARPTLAASAPMSGQPTPAGATPRGTLPLGSGRIATSTASPLPSSSGPIPGVPGARVAGEPSGGPRVEDGDFSQPQPITGAGGTRVLEPARKSTTFSSAASEIGLLPVAVSPSRPGGVRLVVGAGAVVLVGAIVLILATRPKPIATTEPPNDQVSSAATERPREVAAAAGAAKTSSASEPDPQPPTVAPALSLTVRVDLQGVPPKTLLTVDGQPATLPLELPRGKQSHRIVLKPPGLAERVLEVDGTHDRLIDVVFEPPQDGLDRRAGRAAFDKSADKSDTRRRSRERAGSGDKRLPPAVGGGSDREAITDI